MDDPFEAIIPNCIIPPDVEISLFSAPHIGEPCSAISPPDIQRLPDSPANPPANPPSNPPADPPANTRDNDQSRDTPVAKESPGISPEDFAALINFLFEKSDRRLGNHDILEIAETKGLPFPPPKWWRPGGYK